MPQTSFLKWAGGKRRQIPQLLERWQGHEGRLVDLTCGSAAVALGLAPQSALLNDVNPYLVNLFKQVQAGLEVTLEFRHDRETFLAYRQRFNSLIQEGTTDGPEAAQLFYYLNRSGFNGLCRFNQRGLFNTPFGDYKQVTYLTDFEGYREAFRGWQFTVGDFAKVALEAGDWVYADPPYDSPEDKGFTSYSPGGFTWDDQERLALFLANHRGPAVAHNAPTPRILELYRSLGFQVELGQRQNRISGSTKGRSKVAEMIAWRDL